MNRSEKDLDFCKIIDWYNGHFEDFFLNQPFFPRYARIQPPLAVSFTTMKNDNAFFLMADRREVRSVTWDAAHLESIEQKVPFQKRYHSHDYFELIYVLNGDVEEWIEGTCVHLQAGDCILLDKNIRHTEQFFAPNHMSSCAYLAVSDECVRTLSGDEYPYENPQSVLLFLLSHLENEKTTMKSFRQFCSLEQSALGPSAIETELNAILSELVTRIPGFSLMSQGHFQRILGLLDNPLKYSQSAPFSTLSSRENLISQIYLLMDASMGIMRIEELASRLNYNQAYLCRLIRTTTGKTFTQLRLSVRLKYAKILLADSACSVSEISDILQFSNRSYFYRAFENAFGMTPIAYRKSCKKL